MCAPCRGARSRDDSPPDGVLKRRGGAMGDGGQAVGGGAGAYAGCPLAFQLYLLTWAQANLRDLPWRRTLDPYAILVSEVMLQQTQVPRVVPRYESFLTRFSGFAALAEAPLPAVLAEWSGLGYN